MSEKSLHTAICEYVRRQYPKATFMSDGSGLRLPIGLAKQYARLKSNKGVPDLFIAEPRGGYGGLFLEIKKAGTKVFKSNGEIYKVEHLMRQYEVLSRLKDLGYVAEFVIGFDHAKAVIDEYFSLAPNTIKDEFI